jgi:hypothetical protein
VTEAFVLAITGSTHGLADAHWAIQLLKGLVSLCQEVVLSDELYGR